MAAINKSNDYDDILECPVCLETFHIKDRKPKGLRCHHTVCLPCLVKIVYEADGNKVKCPICQQEEDKYISGTDVDKGFPDNITVKKLLDRNLLNNVEIKEPVTTGSADEYTGRGEEMVAGGEDVAYPTGVTVSRTGQTLFTDYWNGTLTIVSPQGVKRRIGGWGSGQMEFYRPCDITTNYKEEIMIADLWNRRVKVLSKEGEYLRDIEVDGAPRGLCVDNDKNLYVATSDPLQVIKYNDDEMEVKRMMSEEFDSIRHLVHHRGYLYITDFIANIIHVVTKDLEYITKIGEGLLKYPTGITIDRKNTLLVTGLGRGVVALTLDGELMAKIWEGRIKRARGITTDQDGDKIIVCDVGNKRVVRL